MTVIQRLYDYLQTGGLFNPELMNHDEVSGLIRDAIDLIEEQAVINMRCNQTIKELQAANVFQGSAKENNMGSQAKPAPIKCKITDLYVERPMARDGFEWFIYNKSSGYVIATTYSRSMAEVMLEGIRQCKMLNDPYDICEQYHETEKSIEG